VATLVLLALAGCRGPFSTLDPAGPGAATIVTMWWILLGGASLIFTLVMVLLWLAMRRSDRLAAVPERRWLVHGGLLLPALVLPPLAVYGFVVGERTLARPGEPYLRVEAIGERFRWSFAYPDAPPGPATLDVLHIPAGREVEVLVQSTDVIHSFWVPRLAGKIDAIPGRVNRIRITATNPGTYAGLCAEFCGRNHAEMVFAVIAHDPATYAQALEAAREGAAP